MAKETKKAHAVHEKLATSLEKVWNRQESRERINNILDKQLIPENCMFLRIPRVDPEIFASIPQQAKGHDVKLQRQQTIVVKAAVPITQLINKLMQMKVDQQMSEELIVSLKESASEAFAILSHADSQMLQMRRDDIVPYLVKEFKQLRNDVQKGSEHLFGDNITERIASITRATRATRALTAGGTAKQSSSWSRPNKRRLSPIKSKGPKNLKILPKTERVHREEGILGSAKPIQGLSSVEPPRLTEVSDHPISLLKQYEESFVAGKVKYFLPKWQEITSDKTILNIIEHGLRINLTDIPNQGHFHAPQHAFSYHEKEVTDKEIAKLIAKNVVTQTSLEEGDFISPIFVKPKKMDHIE